MGRAVEPPTTETPIESIRFVAGVAAKRFFSNAASVLFYLGTAAAFIVRLAGGTVPIECYGMLLVLATIAGIQAIGLMVQDEKK